MPRLKTGPRQRIDLECPPLDLIKKKAGKSYFDRGQTLYRQGSVVKAQWIDDEGRYAARVKGTSYPYYEVELKWNGSALRHKCDCPLGEDNAFCKHCVAVGLYWLEASAESTLSSVGKSAQNKVPPLTEDALRKLLYKQPQRRLVEWLTELIFKNPTAQKTFLPRLQRAAAGKINLAEYRDPLLKALHPGKKLYFYDVKHYQQKLMPHISCLIELVDDGFYTEAETITEAALACMDEVHQAFSSVDESIPHNLIELFIDILVRIHMGRREHPESTLDKQTQLDEQLAQKVMAWFLQTPYGYVPAMQIPDPDAPHVLWYRIFIDKIHAAWEALPSLRPTDPEPDALTQHYRTKLTAIQITQLASAQELRGWVPIVKKSLRIPQNWNTLASLYIQMEQHQEAVETLEEALQEFASQPDMAQDRLEMQTALLTLYEKTEQWEPLRALAWRLFELEPNARQYAALKKATARPDDWEDPWPMLRVKALTHLRTWCDSAPTGGKGKMKAASAAREVARRQKTVVEILLADGDTDAAWEAAKVIKEVAQTPLWPELITARSKTHPADAIPYVKQQINDVLRFSDKIAYEMAVKHLASLHTLMQRAGLQKDWGFYLAKLKDTHRNKRLFLAAINKQKWSDPFR